MGHGEPLAIILGIDPGTRTTGWGVVALEGGEPRALACDVISPKSRLPLEQRLEFIFSELGDVIAGRETGRKTPESITLFKSVGLAIEDVALAARLVQLAEKEGLGRRLPF